MSNSPLLVTSFKSVMDFSPQEFAPLAQGRTVYVSQPWLHGVELMRGEPVEYLACHDANKRLVGLLPVYADTSVAAGFYDVFGHFINASGACFSASSWKPGRLIGTREGFDCEFLVDDTAPYSPSRVLSTLLDRAWEDALSAGSVAVSALYINPTGAAQLRSACGDFQYFLGGADTVIDCSIASFDLYTRRLGSRGWTLRRERRRFLEAGYYVTRASLADVVDELGRLSASLERRYGHNTDAIREAERLRLLATATSEISEVLLLLRDKHLVGCLLYLVYERTIYGRTIGFDYDKLVGVQEYFNLAIHSMIELAIERGCTQLRVGMASYRGKISRGASLEPHAIATRTNTAIDLSADKQFMAWNERRVQAVHNVDGELMDALGLP